MTYDELLTTAKSLPPGDTRAAQRWLDALARTLRTERLNAHQRAYLYRLRRVWKRRAAGEDTRWNLWGSMPGRPGPDAAARVRAQRIGTGQAQAVRPAPSPAPASPVSAQPVAVGQGVTTLLDKYR